MSDQIVQLFTSSGKWIAIAAFILLIASCSLLTVFGSRSWCSGTLPAPTWNWHLNSFDGSGAAMKNLCLALGLLDMPTSPARTSISLCRCSHVWSAPMDTNGISFVVPDMLPASSSLQVFGWLLLRAYMSVMYRGQSSLYFILSIAKNILQSASPASRWSA